MQAIIYGALAIFAIVGGAIWLFGYVFVKKEDPTRAMHDAAPYEEDTSIERGPKKL